MSKVSVTSTFDFDQSGDGPAVIFLHGWPFHKGNFDQITQRISKHFRCYALNSLGMAFDGQVPDDADMTFEGHADRVIEFANALGLDRFSLVAHDTGATVARAVAAKLGDRVASLTLLNTEIPNHRPPFIPLFQKLLRLPGARFAFKALLSQRWFRASSMGARNVFWNKDLIEQDFKIRFIDHWFTSPQRFEGFRKYLADIDLDYIDTLDKVHLKIAAPTQFLWGDNDLTFPCELGKRMAKSMNCTQEFIPIKDTCLVPQSEDPETVAKHLLPFLKQHLS